MKTILFDIDGTLILSGGAGMAALEGATQKMLDQPNIDGVVLSGRTDRGVVRDIFQKYQFEETEANIQRFLEIYLAQLRQTIHRKAGRILPGITDLVKLLAQRSDVRLGLLTGNVRPGAEIKLSRYDLDAPFRQSAGQPLLGGFGDVHLDRNDVARDAMASMQQAHGDIDPEETWVIGDTPNDIRCARAVGAKVLAVATGEWAFADLVDHAPDLALRDLSDPGVFFKQLGLA